VTAPHRVELGLRENAAQFTLLLTVNAFVGAMVGLERSTLPLIGRDDFGLASSAAVLSFIVAFGLAKAFTNLAAGALAGRLGRRRLLIAGWTVALPVPLLILAAPSWPWVVAANLLLGVNQGLAWSMTVVMKIDLVGPQRRGLALGLNEAAGYGGVALAAALSGWLASEYAARDVLVVAGAAIAITALAVTVTFVRDTAAHVALEQSRQAGANDRPPALGEAFADASYRVPALRACSQAGLVNNLNDALSWGLVPLFLAAHGASPAEVGLVAGLYPAVWGVGQIWTGHWSDSIGRKPLIVAGMLLQAVALAALALSAGRVWIAAATAVLLGLGTALVYPTLIAAISDAVSPVARAPVVGVYRFWRDSGYVAGGLLAGAVADAIDDAAAIAVVAALTALSGLWVALDLRGRRTPIAPSGLHPQSPPPTAAEHPRAARHTQPPSMRAVPSQLRTRFRGVAAPMCAPSPEAAPPSNRHARLERGSAQNLRRALLVIHIERRDHEAAVTQQLHTRDTAVVVSPSRSGIGLRDARALPTATRRLQ
jgi:MFS family permease